MYCAFTCVGGGNQVRLAISLLAISVCNQRPLLCVCVCVCDVHTCMCDCMTAISVCNQRPLLNVVCVCVTV